jgi:7-carboxy-7-deazaguanine synthase
VVVNLVRVVGLLSLSSTGNAVLGTNPLEAPVPGHDGQVLDVQEVFPTIQGEGPFAGRPATFIRLAGCHLACVFCDTDFLTKRHGATLQDLTLRALDYHNRLVVLTGGEPMRQNVVPLCEELADHGMTVQIETAGSFWPIGVHDERLGILCSQRHVHIVVSPKTGYVRAPIRAYATAWKYIITLDPVGTDGLPTYGTQAPVRAGQHVARPPKQVKPEDIYLQPCDTGNADLNKVIIERCVALCRQHGYRLSLQQHKLLGLP